MFRKQKIIREILIVQQIHAAGAASLRSLASGIREPVGRICGRGEVLDVSEDLAEVGGIQRGTTHLVSRQEAPESLWTTGATISQRPLGETSDFTMPQLPDLGSFWGTWHSHSRVGHNARWIRCVGRDTPFARADTSKLCRAACHVLQKGRLSDRRVTNEGVNAHMLLEFLQEI
jgi:hypothetical protein